MAAIFSFLLISEMTWDFDSIPKYVINLDRRKDRWLSFNSASGVKDLQHLERWSGTDGKTINLDTDERVSLFTKYNITRGIRRSHMELNSKGGVGCYISHVEVWKHFLNNSNSDVALVFEDDVILDESAVNRIKGFIDKSSAIKDTNMWDFCILSPYFGNKKHEPLHIDDQYCMRLVEFNGLTGYLINKKGVKKILPMIYPIQGHVDWFLSICAQLQYIELCSPPKSLLRVRISRTDIQSERKCEICDLTADFDKDYYVLAKWRTAQLHIEEIVLLGLGVYFGLRFLRNLSN